MNLISGRGLNCHLSGLISIADALGLNYLDAFFNLWSEADFLDEPIYNVFVSRRVYANLSAMGLVTEALNCISPEEAEESLRRTQMHEPFLVGMDTFDAPWNPVYRHFHGAHYFVALKEREDAVACFDPLYQQRDQALGLAYLAAHANEIQRVQRVPAPLWRRDPVGEAREILRTHAVTQESIRTELRHCKAKDRQQMAKLIKRMNAMLNNRYLFNQYMAQADWALDCAQPFFPDRFFQQWEALKHGLYKASIIKENGTVLDEVDSLFASLMQTEMAMAKKLTDRQS